MDWINNIKVEELPQQYQDIVRHIGLKNTVKLAMYYGKIGFYFSAIQPGKILREEYQEMSAQIGIENTLKLAKYYKGELIYFRGLEQIIQLKKREHIMANFSGNNHKELARATGLSERWVYEILWDEQKKRRMEKQMKLF